MRILKLRLKNLNSLKGEWKVDFTAAPFADNGLFAITGPTGAGKSTCSMPSAWRSTTRRRAWHHQRAATTS
jgi:Tfp pilus assembly pilus retraction ATPase PilT